MYSGRLQTAIDRLEKALFAEPAVFSIEPLLINLSTMYELHQPNTADSRKMRLLDLVAAVCGDGFDIQCLKLPAVVLQPSVQPLPTAVAPPPPPPSTSSSGGTSVNQQQQQLHHPLATSSNSATSVQQVRP